MSALPEVFNTVEDVREYSEAFYPYAPIFFRFGEGHSVFLMRESPNEALISGLESNVKDAMGLIRSNIEEYPFVSAVLVNKRFDDKRMRFIHENIILIASRSDNTLTVVVDSDGKVRINQRSLESANA